MQKPFILPLPGNSQREQSFYEMPLPPIAGYELPNGAEVTPAVSPAGEDPTPFKIIGG